MGNFAQKDVCFILVAYLIVAVIAWLAGLTSLNDLRAKFDPISTFAILISWVTVVAAAIFLTITCGALHILFLIFVGDDFITDDYPKQKAVLDELIQTAGEMYDLTCDYYRGVYTRGYWQENFFALGEKLIEKRVQLLSGGAGKSYCMEKSLGIQ